MEQFRQLQKRDTPTLTPDITKLCDQMTIDLRHLENLQQVAKNQEEKQYLGTFISILRKINKEVLAAKLRYQSIDRENLIKKRMNYLQNETTLFREHHKIMTRSLKQAEHELKDQEKQNLTTEFEIECLKHAISRKETLKNQSKSVYINWNEAKKLQNPGYLTEAFKDSSWFNRGISTHATSRKHSKQNPFDLAQGTVQERAQSQGTKPPNSHRQYRQRYTNWVKRK